MQNAKGNYGYFGKEQALRRYIQATLREKFELYDFDEVALRPGLIMPLKRFELGKVLRGGLEMHDRQREFLQWNVNVVGIEGPEAEIELMQLALDVFRALAIKVRLKWNNRQFLTELLEAAAVPISDAYAVMLALDKLARAGANAVKAELQMYGLQDTAVSAVMVLIANEESGLEQLIETYSLEGSAGAKEVLAVRNMLHAIGLDKEYVFDPFLSYGPSDYIGTVYEVEVFDASDDGYTLSLGGGGRYVDDFTWRSISGDEAAYSAARMSFELEAIMALLENRVVEQAYATVVLIQLDVTAAVLLQAAAELRYNGVRVKLDKSGQQLEDSLASLPGNGIRYALLLNERNWLAGCVRLLDLEERTEREVSVDEAIYIIGDCYSSRYEQLSSC
ncbi:ATP phosphoribosyltransferase regulatory subunit [Paenibacillus endophyticus]|nr:ATP phosphoribosyltransferase regulatory subunit [Paenibacillus endophyticus]